jgi:hypothetical protein
MSEQRLARRPVVAGRMIQGNVALVWPPKRCRSTAKRRSANGDVSRERKRCSKASVMTGIGQPSSMASITVQRPSPESAT